MTTRELIAELQDRREHLRIRRDAIDQELALIPRLIQILGDRDQLRGAELAMGEACSLPYVSAVGRER